MREKYYVRQYGRSELICVLGLEYRERRVYGEDGRLGPMTGDVCVGGPLRFQELAETIMRVFAPPNEPLDIRELEERRGGAPSKMKWVLCGVRSGKWMRGVQALCDGHGFELERTRTFRRLVW